MARKDQGNFTVLASDMPGDKKKVRAILAAWGLEKNSIRCLLTERRMGRTTGSKNIGSKPQGDEAKPFTGGKARRSGSVPH